MLGLLVGGKEYLGQDEDEIGALPGETRRDRERDREAFEDGLANVIYAKARQARAQPQRALRVRSTAAR